MEEEQGYSFYLLSSISSDCFYGVLMPRYNSKVNGLKAKSCLKQRGIGKPKSNNHYFFEQIKTILLRGNLYFDGA
jgi:hypothetical protein